MLKIVLHEFGVENTLTEIRHTLEDALGTNISKKQKDIAIAKALGAVESLFYMVEIESEQEEQLDE